jgi:hypothetical protein
VLAFFQVCPTASDDMGKLKPEARASSAPKSPDLMETLDKMRAAAERIAEKNCGASGVSARAVLANIRCLCRALDGGDAKRIMASAVLLDGHYQRLVAEHAALLSEAERKLVLPLLA